MARRPCLRCGVLTSSSYCPAHRRSSNLARDWLLVIAVRDRWICQICKEPVTHRGWDADAATLDHIDRNVRNDQPSNLRLVHNRCNVARH